MILSQKLAAPPQPEACEQGAGLAGDDLGRPADVKGTSPGNFGAATALGPPPRGRLLPSLAVGGDAQAKAKYNWFASSLEAARAIALSIIPGDRR